MIDISGYNALEIPPELEKVVRDAIKQGLNGLKTRRAGKRDIAGWIVGKGIGCRLCLICRLSGGLSNRLAL